MAADILKANDILTYYLSVGSVMRGSWHIYYLSVGRVMHGSWHPEGKWYFDLLSLSGLCYAWQLTSWRQTMKWSVLWHCTRIPYIKPTLTVFLLAAHRKMPGEVGIVFILFIIKTLGIITQFISEGHNACIYILCDCQKAIDVFTVHSDFRKHCEICERVLLICNKLVDSSY